MKIGVLGSGAVGKALAEGSAKSGHTVTIGTRDPGKLADWKNGLSAKIGSEAASLISVSSNTDVSSADLIFLATQWGGTLPALQLAGIEKLAGKIVVDVTNPLAGGPPPNLAVVYPDSGGETVQNWLPDSKVVKAFNIVTARYMCNAQLKEGSLDLFIAGNDAEAKAQVADLAKGWNWSSTIDMGDIKQSYWLECLAMTWIYFGFKFNHWTHGFKLLRS